MPPTQRALPKRAGRVAAAAAPPSDDDVAEDPETGKPSSEQIDVIAIDRFFHKSRRIAAQLNRGGRARGAAARANLKKTVRGGQLNRNNLACGDSSEGEDYENAENQEPNEEKDTEAVPSLDEINRYWEETLASSSLKKGHQKAENDAVTQAIMEKLFDYDRNVLVVGVGSKRQLLDAVANSVEAAAILTLTVDGLKSDVVRGLVDVLETDVLSRLAPRFQLMSKRGRTLLERVQDVTPVLDENAAGGTTTEEEDDDNEGAPPTKALRKKGNAKKPKSTANNEPARQRETRAKQGQAPRGAASDRRPILLVVHHLDGTPFRNPTAQEVLSRLAASRRIRLLASVEHANASALWTESQRARYAFSLQPVNTGLPPREELLAGGGGSGKQLKSLNLLAGGAVGDGGAHSVESLDALWRSLPDRTQKVLVLFWRLAHGRHAREGEKFSKASKQGRKPGATTTTASVAPVAINVWDLFVKARNGMLAQSDAVLRQHLTEFTDHYVIKERRSQDGNTLLVSMLDSELVERFLATRGLSLLDDEGDDDGGGNGR